jgi:hypothetical protein
MKNGRPFIPPKVSPLALAVHYALRPRPIRKP